MQKSEKSIKTGKSELSRGFQTFHNMKISCYYSDQSNWSSLFLNIYEIVVKNLELMPSLSTTI